MAKRAERPTELSSPPKPKPRPRPRPKPGPEQPVPPAPAVGNGDGPAVDNTHLSDALPLHVRGKLERAFAEERLEMDLFGTAGQSMTASLVFTPNVVRDLDFLCGWFQTRYGVRGKVNRSGIVRLAIRCLRFELDPRAYGNHPELFATEGPEGPNHERDRGGR